MSKEWPQQNELRAMPLDERLMHASRAALVEDKEAIDMARARIAELENALDDILMHGVERDHGWMMVPKVEWEQAVARANLKPRS